MFYLLIILLQMKLIRQIIDLNKAINDNIKLGFVPTMGGLHKGHISLIKQSKKKCKKTLVSIFVNPKQFNNNNDFESYPRNLNKDLKILKKLKVDIVFLPSVDLIYQNNKSKKYSLKASEKILCAKYRKGHFEGVLEVMDRLIDLILPKYTFMGDKDFQQLFLIKKKISHHKTQIISCKTIRDKNKIALSSRNFLLNEKNMRVAGFVAKKIMKLKSKIITNKLKSKTLIKNFKKDLTSKFNIEIEYLEARNIINLKPNIISQKFKVFIAYYIDDIRLIDNF